MSSPPQYGSNETPANPDSRLLPPGWVQQYNANHKAWFYVNTTTRPPTSSWDHPAGPLPPPSGPPPSQYQPPPGPPPPRNRYGSSQGQCSTPPQGSGYGQPQANWNSPPPSNDKGKDKKSGGPFGGLLGGHHGSGHNYNNAGYGPGPGYGGGYGQPYPPPQTVYMQGNKPNRRFGAGTVAAGAGVGLLGGFLAAEALEDYGEHEYEQGLEAGYDDGFDNGFVDGNDFGGF